MEAVFRTPIPMPEADALTHAPVRWDIGQGESRIRMATPLFTQALYALFTRVSKAIKFRMAQGEEITLKEMLSAGESKEDLPVNDMITEAFQKFHDLYKVLPQNISDLVILVSAPVNVQEATEQLNAWGISSGVGQFSLAGGGSEFWEPAKNIQMALMLYCAHTLSVSSCVLLLSQIQQVNTEIKKKLLPEPQALNQPPKSAFRKLLSHLSRKK